MQNIMQDNCMVYITISLFILYSMYNLDTLGQSNAKAHIAHISLLVTLQNLVSKNGSCTFYVHLQGGHTFSHFDA